MRKLKELRKSHVHYSTLDRKMGKLGRTAPTYQAGDENEWRRRERRKEKGERRKEKCERRILKAKR